MYRIILTCEGVPTGEGAQAAADITSEFQERRTWHENTLCSWDGFNLILKLENDYDENGLAAQDEFSDCISAYITQGVDGDIRVQSVVVF